MYLYQTTLISHKNNGYISKIVDYLYLGDYESSQNNDLLQTNKITFIINLSNAEIYNKYNNIQYIDIHIEDDRTRDIKQYFMICIDIIKECVNNNKNILIHCMNGVSRSVSIIISYLIYSKYTLKEALKYITTIRDNQYTHPNIGFFKQLMVFELDYFHQNSISVGEYIKSISA